MSHQKEGALNQSFQSHNPGQDWLAGKVSGKIEFAGRNPLDGLDFPFPFYLFNPVDQQKGKGMGEAMEQIFPPFPVLPVNVRLAANVSLLPCGAGPSRGKGKEKVKPRGMDPIISFFPQGTSPFSVSG
jgi:hypothetical protein